MRSDDGLPFLEGKLADQPDPLDAGVIDQDVRASPSRSMAAKAASTLLGSETSVSR
jgi:hypothetical protein